jgi:hypothetical protein
MIAFQSYIIASEAIPRIYNFFAVFILDVFFMAGFFAVVIHVCVSLSTDMEAANTAQAYARYEASKYDRAGYTWVYVKDDTRLISIFVAAFCLCGW